MKQLWILAGGNGAGKSRFYDIEVVLLRISGGNNRALAVINKLKGRELYRSLY